MKYVIDFITPPPEVTSCQDRVQAETVADTVNPAISSDGWAHLLMGNLVTMPQDR